MVGAGDFASAGACAPGRHLLFEHIPFEDIRRTSPDSRTRQTRYLSYRSGFAGCQGEIPAVSHKRGEGKTPWLNLLCEDARRALPQPA